MKRLPAKASACWWAGAVILDGLRVSCGHQAGRRDTPSARGRPPWYRGLLRRLICGFAQGHPGPIAGPQVALSAARSVLATQAVPQPEEQLAISAWSLSVRVALAMRRCGWDSPVRPCRGCTVTVAPHSLVGDVAGPKREHQPEATGRESVRWCSPVRPASGCRVLPHQVGRCPSRSCLLSTSDRRPVRLDASLALLKS